MSSPKDSEQRDTNSPALSVGILRTTSVVVALAIGIAVGGFLFGTDESESAKPRQLVQASQPSDGEDQDIAPAASYSEMAEQRRGPNADWTSNLDQLRQPEVDVFAPVEPDAQAKAQSLASRSDRRAFSGAPPVVPHTINQKSDASCLLCHGQGKAVGSISAPKISHQRLISCTQCHVENTNPVLPPPVPGSQLASNSFVGVASAMQGARIAIGAPPTIPHATWMRKDCTSCHGPGGKAGIRTSHSWRNSCLQCHAISATQDQIDFLHVLD